MTALLEARRLSKTFGAVHAAQDISVAVEAGEVVGVIGANGAGKTTFVNMVTGYLKPSSGSIVFRGRDITALPPRRVTRLGICRSFQIAQLFPDMTTLENLLIAQGLADPKRPGPWAPLVTAARLDAGRAVLARYGIEPYGDVRVATLPQGVRKLLDIAMAMVSQPAVLLLDEPTSGVSAAEKFGMMDTVMAALGPATILFVEHDMEVVERFAQRVLAFYDGRIIADGAPAAVLADADVRTHVVGRELHRRREA